MHHLNLPDKLETVLDKLKSMVDKHQSMLDKHQSMLDEEECSLFKHETKQLSLTNSRNPAFEANLIDVNGSGRLCLLPSSRYAKVLLSNCHC